eukprot:jgi/Psemu1/292348/fgenesh1_pg.1016_\
MLSLDLLQALLCPDAGVRDQAETVFRSMNILERVQALTNLLLTSTAAGGDNPGVSLLIAVLLRRDILKLTDPSMLNELVAPLLQCYTNTSNNEATRNTKIAVGHCLAEICSSLSVIGSTPTAVDSVVTKLIATVVDACAGPALDQEIICSLKFFAALADRAPMAFARVGMQSLSGVVNSCLQKTNSNTADSNLWTKLVEVVVNGAVATTVTEVSPIRGAAAATKDIDEIVIDETGPASQIGTHCLLPILMRISESQSIVSLELLQCLTHASVTCPSLFCGGGPSLEVLQALVQLCLDMSSANDESNKDISLAALQVLASLVSVGDVRHRVFSPIMAQSLAEKVIPTCVKIMAQAGADDEDAQDWSSEPATLVEDGVDEGDGNEDASFAESLIESFFQNLASPALTVALPIVRQFLDPANPNADWKHARAGLAILEAGLIAAPVALAPHVPEIIGSVANILGGDSTGTNQHPRVRYQAIRLMGTICETHPSVRRDHGQIILERSASALGSPVSKLSAMASRVISSYCRGGTDVISKDGAGMDDEEELKEQCLVPFLPNILNALIQGPLSNNDFDTGSVAVRVRAMNATACLAEACDEAFHPYYSHVMPGLLASVQLPQVDVATAALQSLTILGQAVGKEMFESDAKQVLSWIVPVLPNGSSTSPSSFASEELLSACARIASVLEEDFAPYVDAVLPSLYQLARAPADISIEEGNESGLQSDTRNSTDIDDDGTMTVAIPGRGFQRITINTSAILEKATNNRIMFELTKALGPAFGPRVQESIDTFLPLTKFAYSADVRSTAAQALSALFDSACAYGEEIGDMTLPQKYLPSLSDTISEQIASEDPSDIEALYALADSLSEIYYVAYGFRNDASGNRILQDLSMPMRVEVVKRCMKTMTDCLGRRDGIAKILQGNLSGADEHEDYAAQLRGEDNLLTPLVDSIGYLLKFSKSEFVPVFETEVVPKLGKYLSSTSDLRASVAAMCLFDDVVEHCGSEAAAKYSPILLQGVMIVMSDPSKYDKDLVQAAVYGIAQMSRYAPSSSLSSNIQTIVHQLMTIAQGDKENAGDGVYLYEIAVSALASLVMFGPFKDLKFVNRSAVTEVFLKSLPLQQDEDEAKICHAGLCSLIEKGFIDIQVEAPRIISIAGSILSDVKEGIDVASADTCERLVKILYDMQSENSQAMQQVFVALDPDIQNVISYAVQGFAQSQSSVVTP